MLQYDPRACLPSSEELPDSDETPVDNELQKKLSGLLEDILTQYWAKRTDWFFGADMGVYFAPKEPPLVPDGFLSLGVDRFGGHEDGRLSYVLWEENGIVPTVVFEFVSQSYRGEYDTKMDAYANLGVLYYAIYAPRRQRKRSPLEVYRLENGQYIRLLGPEPYRLPEIGLGVGRGRGTFRGRTREWLYWYDHQGQRLLHSEEQAQQALAQAQQEAQARREAEARAASLAQNLEALQARLKALGLDP
ncbi:Uma2 family endonuclease [Anthocerotibacter panamensis]|uniref:Uma2 family endonuclease n=1 Tax=Anthocerotibacter panamensis TaxID=2857077 RepID=UPI001C404339|nr:Uma2 family endonuclease [Anthocerotibacter panamensis]